MDKTYEVLKEVTSVLPERIALIVLSLPKEIKEDIQEIRLRINMPVTVSCNKHTYYLTDKSFTADLFTNLHYIKVTKGDINECFSRACTYSVYNRQSEISNGFITINGGHRMGISGSAVYGNDELINVKDISSLNIRVSREFIGCSRNLLEQLQNSLDSMLICGKPCSGKTTLIRDIARSLSLDYGKKVCVIDSRNEISATFKGEPQKDLGNADVFTMYRKSDGITQAIRNMSPDFVICDEILTKKEVEAISHGVNSGVNFIATVHCTSAKELVNKTLFKEILSLNTFSKAVILKSKNYPCTVDSIIDMKELFKKNEC